MPSALQDVLAILDLEPLEVNLFRGRSPQSRWQRVFGGQVIGQALVAACRTVDDVAQRPPHSLHAYFLLGGDPKVPIIYEVDRIRDGRSFTTRRVMAIQHGRAIFSMEVSFHGAEEGLSHQFPMPDVPKPDELRNEAEARDRVLSLMPDPVRRYYDRERPIDLRPVEYGRYLGEKLEGGRFHMWIRATERLPDEPAIHQCVLAYASDMTLLDAALIPHGRTVFHQDIMAASLRPRAVVPPPLSCRRVAPVRPGQPQPQRCSRLLSRFDLCPRRHAGRLSGAGGSAAPTPSRASLTAASRVMHRGKTAPSQLDDKIA